MSLWEVLTSFFAFIGQTMVTWWPFSARARPGSIAAILTLLALRRKHKDYWIGSTTSNLIGSQNKKWPQFAPWTTRSKGMRKNIIISETSHKTETQWHKSWLLSFGWSVYTMFLELRTTWKGDGQIRDCVDARNMAHYKPLVSLFKVVLNTYNYNYTHSHAYNWQNGRAEMKQRMYALHLLTVHNEPTRMLTCPVTHFEHG